MAKQKSADVRMQWVAVECDIPIGAASPPYTVQFPTTISTAEKIGVEIKEIMFAVDPQCLEDGFADTDCSILWSLHAIERGVPEYGTTAADLFPADTYYAGAKFGGYDAAATERPVEDAVWYVNPPEPILAHPAALFFSVLPYNFANAAIVRTYCRIGFKYVDLSDSEYQQIMQSILIQNVL